MAPRRQPPNNQKRTPKNQLPHTIQKPPLPHPQTHRNKGTTKSPHHNKNPSINSHNPQYPRNLPLCKKNLQLPHSHPHSLPPHHLTQKHANARLGRTTQLPLINPLPPLPLPPQHQRQRKNPIQNAGNQYHPPIHDPLLLPIPLLVRSNPNYHPFLILSHNAKENKKKPIPSNTNNPHPTSPHQLQANKRHSK